MALPAVRSPETHLNHASIVLMKPAARTWYHGNRTNQQEDVCDLSKPLRQDGHSAMRTCT